jgi:hypothetical protein
MKNSTSSLHVLKAYVRLHMSCVALLLAVVVLASVTSITFQRSAQLHPHTYLASVTHLVDDHDPWD